MSRVEIDPELLQEAQRLGGFGSGQETVQAALIEIIKRRSQLAILELFGQFEPDADYDYKTARQLCERPSDR